MPKKNNPGCGCCDPCVVFTDNFERSNSTTLGNGWTERSGNWSIVDGKLTIASPSSGNTATVTPTGDAFVAAWSASAKLQSDTEGDELGVVLGWSDVNNRTYALLKIHNSAATVRYVRVSGGSVVIDREEPVEAPTGMPHELRISYIPSGTPHTIVVSLNGRNVCGGSGTVTTSSLFGNHLRLAGAICGNISGTATWDDVRVDQCDHPQCAQELEFLDTFDSQRSFWETFSSPFSLTGGRLRAVGNGGDRMRCVQLPDNLLGLTLSIKAKVYFNSNTQTASICWQFSEVPFDTAALTILPQAVTDQYRLDVSTVGTVDFGGTATSGDELELRFINKGTPTLWDVEAYINGNLEESLDSINFQFEVPSLYGVNATASAAGMEVEWDDFEYSAT